MKTKVEDMNNPMAELEKLIDPRSESEKINDARSKLINSITYDGGLSSSSYYSPINAPYAPVKPDIFEGINNAVNLGNSLNSGTSVDLMKNVDLGLDYDKIKSKLVPEPQINTSSVLNDDASGISSNLTDEYIKAKTDYYKNYGKMTGMDWGQLGIQGAGLAMNLYALPTQLDSIKSATDQTRAQTDLLKDKLAARKSISKSFYA